MQTNKKGLKKNSTKAPKRAETKSPKKTVAKTTKKSTTTVTKKAETKTSRKVAKKTTKKPETKVSKKVTTKTTKKPDTKSSKVVSKTAKKPETKVSKKVATKTTKKPETKSSKVASKTAKKPETKVSKNVATKATKKPDTKSSKKAVKTVPKKKVKKEINDETKRVASLATSFITLLTILVIYVVLINRPVTNEVKYDSAEPETKIVVEEKKKEKINITISPDVDLEAERKKYKNDDIVARLEIPDLMNILVVKGSNNSYYLNRSIKKKKDNRGTEFMDYRVNPDSKQINIYGHNSRTYDIPFRKLEKFLDKDFFEDNKYIVLQTDSGRRIYKIFSIKEYASDYEYMVVDLTGKDFVNHIGILKQNSLNSREVEYDENSNLLILQTCTYGKKNHYYIISAIEIEVEE